MAFTHTGVYITDSNNQTVELPVAPAEYAPTHEVDSNTDTVLGLGEVIVLGKDKLRTIEIQSTFPRDMDSAVWATAEQTLDSADDYIKFLEDAMAKQKPVRVVVSNSSFNLQGVITKFEPSLKNTVDYDYTLDVTEYRDYKAKKLGVPKKTPMQTIKIKLPKVGKQRPAPAKKIGMGSAVVVNGQLHRDSYGTGPGQTEHNATLKISNIAPGRKYPYHVSNGNGGWLGWVSAGAVKLK